MYAYLRIHLLCMWEKQHCNISFLMIHIFSLSFNSQYNLDSRKYMNTLVPSLFNFVTSSSQLTISINYPEDGGIALQIVSNQVGTFNYSVRCLEQGEPKRTLYFNITILSSMYFLYCSVSFTLLLSPSLTIH